MKRFFRGTHRLVPPVETLARLRGLMSAMGITRVGNITGLDRIGIPVALSFRPNSRALAVSQGKGLDLEEAKAGALMESIESYHAERVTLPLKFGGYEDLCSTHHLVDVHRLPQAKYTPFHSRLPLLWVEGYDLLQREPIWLPFELATTNFTLPYPPGFGCFQASSNGLAAGNHLLEAISHAVCELVERDALALWNCLSREERSERRVMLDTVDDPGCGELLEQFDRAGIDVAVWETTTDVGLPAFRCTIAERQPDPTHFFYSARGAGCHPSRAIALSRALTEAAQSRLTFIAGSRDNVTRDDYDRARNTDSLERRRREWKAEAPNRDFRTCADWQATTLRDDLLAELDRLRAAGIDRVIVVDLTRPDLGIPVVKAVVPGLEGLAEAWNYVPGARARAMGARE
ncbi:MAG TPA: YcaO-like family protein [Candidatus Acidoferrales bacterium]|nr:YcaO-like family protein [Candidatus Acidoferrales bacterium]